MGFETTKVNYSLEKKCQNSSSRHLPDWIRIKVAHGGARENISALISKNGLNTVCSSAKCPNLGECWHRGTATFMILGDDCTRNCTFCAVKHSKNPSAPDPEEATKIAKAVATMKLKHAVITSVTRDDLEDCGAGAFAKVANAIRRFAPDTTIELLTPDFMGRKELIMTVLEAYPDILNHNMETVRRLTPEIRSGADYDRSLDFLSYANKNSKGLIKIKSGIMLGLGESENEIEETIRDIHKTGASMLTIGQYLRPTRANMPEARFAHPNEFERWKKFSMELGFKSVWSGPLVRSSYMAEEQNCK
ncbi:MAG TPA: lipoyl synthase [Victivallales bacterium]|nr:lipoyl synthase [Victivallales bacterium]